MKLTDVFYVVLVTILLTSSHSVEANSDTAFPEFEFDVWASPPSRQVYTLSREPLVQRILYSIEETASSVEDIAVKMERPEGQILEKLNELSNFGLVRQEGQRWLSCIPLYTEDELRVAEQIGEKYAEEEARILRSEIPRLKTVFHKTLLSKYFSWDEVSLVIVGALLSDFCVFDRISFMPEHYREELQPSLVSPSGKRWGYDGFQKLPERFPSRKWRFYQNQFSKYSGGLTRFGFYGENRPSQPSRPEGWIRFEQGKILFALAEGPQTFEALQKLTRLKPEILRNGLNALQDTSPPAVVLQNGSYRSKIPILCEADRELLVRECDRVAEIIFERVICPHYTERVARGKALGSRWPLPAGTYVRDKALQIVIEDGQIGPAPASPVGWNFGVWGWKGFLPMHDQVKEDLKPDPFLLTSVSESEIEEMARLNGLKDKILGQESLVDISTPAHAYLTWISAYAHSDIEALRRVELPADRVDKAHLEKRTKQGWLGFIGKVDIRRLPPVPSNPKDGDVCPVFTMHEKGFEEAYLFFFYDNGWRYLGNTPRDGLWHDWAQTAVTNKLALLKKH
jgi:hypothetical protein